jgi:hypothetical protein
MKAAILIGNGLNRCYLGAIPWDSLLQNIANDYGVSFNRENPFPLEFESIVNQILSGQKSPSDSIYGELKQRIAHAVNEQQPEGESLHELFTNQLPINHILTTNYDYMLERSYSNIWTSYQLEKEAKETKYSLYRHTKIGPKSFYHIHGEARYPSTLCLGFEHYAGYLTKMREYLRAAPNMSDRVRHVEQPNERSWLELFFSHDIYIVGLTLDSCEIDLWWLLTYRAYLYYSNDGGLKDIMKNRVVLYYTNSTNRYMDLFTHLHVDCEQVPVHNEDYLSTYHEICERIQESIMGRTEMEREAV